MNMPTDEELNAFAKEMDRRPGLDARIAALEDRLAEQGRQVEALRLEVAELRGRAAS